MSLMGFDLQNARRVLVPWGVSPENVSIKWYDGEVSLIVREGKVDNGFRQVEEHLESVIRNLTTITLPIVTIARGVLDIDAEAKKPFRFNFSSSS